jgi:hypothetical protein
VDPTTSSTRPQPHPFAIRPWQHDRRSTLSLPQRPTVPRRSLLRPAASRSSLRRPTRRVPTVLRRSLLRLAASRNSLHWHMTHAPPPHVADSAGRDLALPGTPHAPLPRATHSASRDLSLHRDATLCRSPPSARTAAPSLGSRAN